MGKTPYRKAGAQWPGDEGDLRPRFSLIDGIKMLHSFSKAEG
jgi:hypothetical protein